MEQRLVSKPILADALVWMLILFLGVLQWSLYPRASGFIFDATYYELGQSLVEKGQYGYNSRPETMLPPGFAVIVAIISLCFGNSYAIHIHSMAVFATAFLLATYALLRREVGRFPAGATCLLIGSSQFFFNFSTSLVFSDLPYAFTSTLALLTVLRFSTARTRGSRAGWCLSFGCLLACSLLLRSSGIAMLAALAGWLVTSAATGHDRSGSRLKAMLPLMVFGIAIQVFWMTWAAKNQQPVWPLDGYPGSYFSQLKLKNGNYPELGRAYLVDMPERVENNVTKRSTGLLAMLTVARPPWVDPEWHSPAVAGIVLLLLIGLIRSPWVGPSALPQWYFVCHEAMYLLWPWQLEMRFILPVAPLACMYLWRGGEALVDLIRREKTAGMCVVILSTIMAMYPLYLVIVRQQGKKSAAFWVSFAICSACVTWLKVARCGLVSLLSRTGLLRVVAALVVAGVVVTGLFLQVRMGLTNVHFDVTAHQFYPDIEAALWLQCHADPDAVVMARKEDLVYHYCRRKVIWFPPSSDANLLMNGIVKHHVHWVVVVDRIDSYFLPAEEDCFASLAHQYAQAFRLTHRGLRYRIYEVTAEGRAAAAKAAAASGAGPGRIEEVAGRANAAGLAEVGAGAGGRLRPEQLGGAVALPGAGLPGDRQQPQRADAAGRSAGLEQLGRARERNRGQDGGGAVHGGGDVQAPGDRPVRLPEGGAPGAVRLGGKAGGRAVAGVAAGQVAAAPRAGLAGRRGPGRVGATAKAGTAPAR
jgi:hypothetical protein